MSRAIDLPHELETFVDGLVESGRYDDPAAVVRRALRILQRMEAEREAKLTELRRLVQEGVDDEDAGDWNVDEYKARLNAERETRRPAAE